MSATKKTIVQKINEAFAAGNVEAFLEQCTDDITWNMLGDQPIRGKTLIAEFCAKMPQEPPQFFVNTIIAEGEMVMANGDMLMKNKDGVPEEFAFCDVYQFEGDKVKELTTYVVKKVNAKTTKNGVV